MNACNADVSSLIGQLGSTVQSFSTAELDSCNYCPIRSVAKQGSVYTVTTEVDIASNVATTADVLSNMTFLNNKAAVTTNEKLTSSQLGNSKTFDLIIDAEFTDTIAIVKQKIYQTKGIPVAKQRILYKDSYGMPHVVNDNVTLNEIRNVNSQSITVINGVDIYGGATISGGMVTYKPTSYSPYVTVPETSVTITYRDNNIYTMNHLYVNA
jgi:hypothetical protein